ncbi:unnamed protein product [Malus baccata var. baccata]
MRNGKEAKNKRRFELDSANANETRCKSTDVELLRSCTTEPMQNGIVWSVKKDITRAVLEVYVSFHENDEFWYSNALNEYITANNLRGTPGNGSFREQSTKTKGELSKHISLPVVVSLVLDFKGLNGTFLTRVGKYVSSTGWVKSSYGNITTDTIQDLYNSNTMVMKNDGNT